jgi:hypothetical protein
LQRVETALQELTFETAATDVRLSNALTGVSLLMNQQFIENRVYEEDALVAAGGGAAGGAGDLSGAPGATLTAQMVLGRFREAYSTGLQALRLYEPFVVGAPSTVITVDPAVPANPYSMPVPALIGSSEFFADEALGMEVMPPPPPPVVAPPTPAAPPAPVAPAGGAGAPADPAAAAAAGAPTPATAAAPLPGPAPTAGSGGALPVPATAPAPAPAAPLPPANDLFGTTNIIPGGTPIGAAPAADSQALVVAPGA